MNPSRLHRTSFSFSRFSLRFSVAGQHRHSYFRLDSWTPTNIKLKELEGYEKKGLGGRETREQETKSTTSIRSGRGAERRKRSDPRRIEGGASRARAKRSGAPSPEARPLLPVATPTSCCRSFGASPPARAPNFASPKRRWRDRARRGSASLRNARRVGLAMA